MGVSENNILQTDFEQKKLLQKMYKMYRCTRDTEALRIIRNVSDSFIF